jgi:S1-C subfamily serine protease
VIVDAQKGYVLTANHVVAQASLVRIRTKDGRKFAAKLVGRDAPTDVALVQIKDPSSLDAIKFGNSDALRSATSSLPSAILSALGRPSLQASSAHWGAPVSSSKAMRNTFRLMRLSTPATPAEA